MKKGTLNRVFMLKRINTVMNTNREKWESNPKSAAVMSELEALIARFDELFVQQSGLKEPYGKIKQENLNVFFPNFTALQGYAYSAAVEAKDVEKVTLFSKSESALRKGSVSVILSRVQYLYGQMSGLATAIAEYEGGAELYQEVGEAIAFIAAEINQPRERKRELRHVTNLIQALEEESTIFLNTKLDPLAKYFKRLDPNFYSVYRMNRVIPKYDLKVGVPVNATDPVYPEASGDSPGEGGEQYS